jgi:hypothetical protein
VWRSAPAVETACEQARDKPPEMIRTVVEAFVHAKRERVGLRSREALESVLQTAPELESTLDRFAIEMTLAAMVRPSRGPFQSVLETLIQRLARARP